MVDQFGMMALQRARKVLDRETAISALRAFILDGAITAGDRLPPERELIDSLGMSTHDAAKGA